MEFNRSGNITEVLNRIDLIKHIRIMNLPNLLHLQKNLKDELNHLKNLKRPPRFNSKEETKALPYLRLRYERILKDYSYSLLLDIMCTEVEVLFSICKSFEEVKSRLSSQKNQVEFLKTQSSEFETVLNKKFSELIKDLNILPSLMLEIPLIRVPLNLFMWNDSKTSPEKRKNIEDSWKQIKKTIFDFDLIYRNHIESIETQIKPKERTIFLKLEADEYKKTCICT